MNVACLHSCGSKFVKLHSEPDHSPLKLKWRIPICVENVFTLLIGYAEAQWALKPFSTPSPGWRPVAAVVPTAAHGFVQHHNRDICRLGHLHRHSLRKPVLILCAFPFIFFPRISRPYFYITLCRSGEPGPTQAALAVWDADGVSCQWRGGLLCWCLVSKKGSWHQQVLMGAANRDSVAFFVLQPPLCAPGRSSPAGVARSRAPAQVVAISRAQTHTGLQKCTRTNRQVRLFSHFLMWTWC